MKLAAVLPTIQYENNRQAWYRLEISVYIYDRPVLPTCILTMLACVLS